MTQTLTQTMSYADFSGGFMGGRPEGYIEPLRSSHRTEVPPETSAQPSVYTGRMPHLSRHDSASIPVSSLRTAPSEKFEPTWHGHLHTTLDALVLVEACLSGVKHHCPRRPHDKERAQVIRSGSVFVYEENASGIKRWTDGLTWSPSRIMGNFLVYRELDKPFPPGQKKAAKRKRGPSLERDRRRGSIAENGVRTGSHPPSAGSETPNTDRPTGGFAASLSAQDQRRLVGSLIDSYGFKEGGLIKKTLSVKYRGTTHHIIGYYSLEDAVANILPRPHYDSTLVSLMPRPELCENQSFRTSIHDQDDIVSPISHPGDGQENQVPPSAAYDPRTGGQYFQSIHSQLHPSGHNVVSYAQGYRQQVQHGVFPSGPQAQSIVPDGSNMMMSFGSTLSGTPAPAPMNWPGTQGYGFQGSNKGQDSPPPLPSSTHPLSPNYPANGHNGHNISVNVSVTLPSGGHGTMVGRRVGDGPARSSSSSSIPFRANGGNMAAFHTPDWQGSAFDSADSGHQTPTGFEHLQVKNEEPSFGEDQPFHNSFDQHYQPSTYPTETPAFMSPYSAGYNHNLGFSSA